MANNLSNLETHLAAAIEIGDLAAREAYLRHACEGDSRQLEELQGMVQDYFAAGSLFDRPAVLAPTLDVGGQPEVGAWIGPYKLRELLGEGGMGSVYVAEQEKPVRRKVALKVIKLGMDSRQVIARFEAERQALALMEHINIARVLDAGKTQGGRPYFVMELVRGQPITEHCDIAELDTRERLELFLQVCRAVQHAHQKGIIHRDLKPSNVLVAMNDAEPVVKVIDFGIAKAIGQQLTDNTLYTAFSQMVGTPLYMSPEQAGHSNLDIDTRSDIYSLGVLLYELLTGDTPFDRETLKQAGFDEIRRIIREIEPPKPSARFSTLKAANQSTIAHHHRVEPGKLSQLLRGELDWIVMKAMEKDRQRRYESANGLARDVERYLNDEPVEACPPTATYRLKKLFRRHQSKAIAAAMVLTALMIAAATSVTLAVHERQAAQRRLIVQRGINDALTDVAHLRSLASTSSLGEQETLTRAREQILRAKALADTGDAEADVISRVQQLAAELDLEQRDSQLLAALDAAWLADPNFDWDRRFANRNSISLLRNALAADGLEVGVDDPHAVADRIKSRSEMVQAEIIAALYEWYSVLAPPIGVVLKGGDGLVNRVSSQGVAGRDATADWLWAVIQAADPDPWRQQVRNACELQEVPQRRAKLEELVDAADLSRQPVRFLNQLGAELMRANAIDRATTFLKQVWQQHPADLATNITLAICLRRNKPPKIEQGLQYYTAAIGLRPESALLRNMRGVVFNELGETEEAFADFSEAIRLDPDFATAHSNLGGALAKQGKLDEALNECREAIRLMPERPDYHLNLGIILSSQGKLEEGIAEYREAIRLNPKYAVAHNNLGFALLCQGKSQAAVVACREAIRLNAGLSEAHYNLGSALVSSPGKLDEAVAEYREAIRLNPDVAVIHFNLAIALTSQLKLEEAIAAYREAIRLEPKYPEAHTNLGNLLAKQGYLDKAIVEYRAALRIMPFAEAYIAHTALSKALRQQGNFEDASDEYGEAILAYREVIRLVPNTARFLNGLAWLLATSPEPKWREPAQAVELAKKAIQLAPENGGYLNTLGVAQYRAADWEDAIKTFSESMRFRAGGNSGDWFFLAMAHWQLDDQLAARTWYDRAVAWMDKNKPEDEELLRFRAEATELLAIQQELIPAQEPAPTPAANAL